MPSDDQARDDVAAHVVIGVVVVGVGADGVDEHLGGEDVVAHRHERLLGIVGRARRIGRLLDELQDAPGLVGVDAPECAGLRPGHADAGHGRARSALDVELHHLLGVHPVHVVRAEHDDVVGVLVVDQVQRLIDRVGRAGVPARPQPLLGGHRRDVFAGQAGQSPVLRDVAVQRMRLVLGENTDAQVSGVDQIGQHEVDQPVGAAEGNCRLCSVRRQRIKPLALPAGQHDAEDVWQLPHDSNLSAGSHGDQAFALLNLRGCPSR